MSPKTDGGQMTEGGNNGQTIEDPGKGIDTEVNGRWSYIRSGIGKVDSGQLDVRTDGPQNT